MAVSCLRCCTGVSLIAVSGGLLITVASLVKHDVWGAQASVVDGKPRWTFEKHFDSLSPDIEGLRLDPKAC